MNRADVERRIDAMWERAMEGVTRAEQEAPNTERWKRAHSFAAGFWFALGLLAKENQMRRRGQNAT